MARGTLRMLIKVFQCLSCLTIISEFRTTYQTGWKKTCCKSTDDPHHPTLCGSVAPSNGGYPLEHVRPRSDPICRRSSDIGDLQSRSAQRHHTGIGPRCDTPRQRVRQPARRLSLRRWTLLDLWRHTPDADRWTAAAREIHNERSAPSRQCSSRSGRSCYENRRSRNVRV